MRSMEYAIGIDVGTTNSKVLLCRLPACDVVHLEKFATPKIEDGTYVDFDVHALKHELARALTACADVADMVPISFISVASVGESGVLVYPDGSHDGSSIAWFDTRGREYVDELHADGSAAVYYERMGIPAHSNYGLFKLLWMRDHGSQVAGATWLPLGDFVAWWLNGERAQDESLASRTFVMDVASGKTDTSILERYGLDASLFPHLVESGVSRGAVRPEIARRTGLPANCQVCVAGHDHMAGSIACDLDPDSEILNSTGTSEGILRLNREPVLTNGSFQARLSNGRYVRDGRFSYYASLPTAGFALEWVAEMMGIDQDTFFDVLPARMHRRYLADEFVGRELVFIPHLRGSGPPRRSVHAKGCLYGFSDTTTREDLFYGATLGLALELKNLYDHMLGNEGCRVAKVIGPSIKSPLWMQLKADALGVEVRACRVRESVARGAVMLAAQKAGREVVSEFESTVYTCNPERHSYLSELFSEHYRAVEEVIAAIEP
ncbi:hypothetical protein K6V98_04310 [Collinsella sp. AGMB00827]|uniref:Carbohydrate kinase n=1 Tax=Collinsella ureilytica TaxID=2869515 RepID=A0ABS7MJM8_9ACTN|nr:FGGY family carbohydrate kinase [Collinsella urealyticum]MBY4797577.1 hypothetical protein [Collinsella urealyticum]